LNTSVAKSSEAANPVYTPKAGVESVTADWQKHFIFRLIVIKLMWEQSLDSKVTEYKFNSKNHSALDVSSVLLSEFFCRPCL
jgi:hypothetical protein